MVVLVTTFMLSALRAAWAAERRVALVEMDPALAEAVTRGLSAWDVEVVRVARTRPGSDVQAAAGWAHALAVSEHAGAVVWLAPEQQAATPSLWMYDAETDQIVVRHVNASPPYDDATAAAVALSVKTLLRSSAVAPPSERTAAPTSTAESPAATALAPSAPSRTLRFEAALGVRPVADTWELRGGLGVSWWPERYAGRVGLAIDARVGAGVTIATPAFFGRFSETALRFAVRPRLLGGERFELGPELGGALHLASIDGEIEASGAQAHALRLDPALFGGVLADILVGGRVALGVYAEGTYLLRTQEYAAAGQTFFDPSPFQLDLGLRATFALN
jgi:hypothetical protein